MAGDGDTPTLVSAVSKCGALGCIGATYLSPAQIAETARAVRPVHRDLSASTFAPLPRPEMVLEQSLAGERVTPYYAELGLAPPEPPTVQRLRSTNRLLLRSRAARPSSASRFALLPPEAIAAVKTRGMFVMSRFERTPKAITPC
jgi:nitronate monooxygenase